MNSAAHIVSDAQKSRLLRDELRWLKVTPAEDILFLRYIDDKMR